MLRRIALAGALSLAVSAPALAQGSKLIVADLFPPAGGFALETDDAHLLMRLGCMEAMTRINFEGQLEPALAESWKQTSPTTWEFKLRANVKFQDGQALTAQGVATILNSTLNAKSPARGFSPKTVKSIEVAAPDVVRVTTPSASVIVPLMMASPNTGILSPAALKDGKIDPVGKCSGPFTVTEVKGLETMALKRNDGYWGSKALLAAVEVRFLQDANVRAIQVRTGESHLARTIPTSTVGTFKSDAKYKLASIDSPRTAHLLINNKKAPLDNAKVRQAIQAAIDTRAISASLYEGVSLPAVGPFAPHEPWAPKDAKPAAFDVNKAKALLAEANIKPGTLTLELYAYTERTEFKDLAAVIQQQLKAIGIEVKIRLANYSAIEPDMYAGKHDLALLSRSHLIDVADPSAFLISDYSCKGGYNLSHYCNAAMDEELTRIITEPDSSKRFAAYQAMAKKLQDEAVNVFIVHDRINDAMSSKVMNYRPHPLTHYVLTPTLDLK